MAWNDDLDPESPAYGIAEDKSARIRVVAGPGTGKSFALKRRVARLLEEGVRPKRILPVTFTRVAAEDLHRELVSLGIEGSENLHGRTLHSLGLSILRRSHVLESTGRVPRPLNQFEIEPLLCDLPTIFGGKRDRGKRMRAYEAAWARLQHEEPGFAQDDLDVDFEQQIVNWLIFHEAMLIGEIIPEVYRYLRDNPKAELARNKPGTLILTYSRRMGQADALGSGISPAAIRHGFAYFDASRFIAELGPDAPQREQG